MARPRSFDVDDVLQRATELLWSKGYEATSVRDLEVHLGVGRQSIYNTFGDKHSLFVLALSRYAKDSLRIWGALNTPTAGLAEIRGFFDDIVVFATPEGDRPACFVINTVAELGETDERASRICRENRETLALLFRRALTNAVEGGEISAPADMGAAADFLVAQTYGTVLLGKGGASRQQLSALVRQALKGIA